jgi:hypothetical protein
VVFPSEIRSMPGNRAACGAQKRESGLSAVSLLPCGPLALIPLIPVNGQKRNRGNNSDLKIAAAHAPGVAGR